MKKPRKTGNEIIKKMESYIYLYREGFNFFLVKTKGKIFVLVFVKMSIRD